MSSKMKVIAAIFIVITAGVAGKVILAQSNSALDNTNIRKPLSDLRNYERIQLENGLDVLLISDPTSETASAALNVEVGSWQDPDSHPGLAHFLEHMLFLGTEKYPDSDEYGNFIQSHGGQQNAFTTNENTAYFFDIEAEYFPEALDRFAQFFIAPTFDADLVERERNAVHAEYNMGLQQDGRRVHDAKQTAFNQDHPDSRFSVGNLNTLPSDTVRDQLISFYSRYYSAKVMTLVVYSNLGLLESEQLVRQKFESVPQHVVEIEPYPELFKPNQLPRFLQVKSIKDLREMSVSFPVPGPNNSLSTKPEKLIAWAINQEHEGSLSSVLKAKGYADSVRAGVSANTSSETLFKISIQLTQAGEKSIDEIGRLIFDSLELIKNNGIAPWYFAEIKRLQELRFNYQEAYDPTSYALSLVTQIDQYDEFNSLYGPYGMDIHDPAIISQYLTYLSPENALVTYVSPLAKTTDSTAYYQTKFDLNQLPEEWLALWSQTGIDPTLRQAEPNAFVPESLEIFRDPKKPSELYPYLPGTLIDQLGFTLWHLQTTEFNSPKLDIMLSLQSDWFDQTVQQQVSTELYLAIVRDALEDVSRDATLAGLGYGLWKDKQGISLRVYGYQNKLPLYSDYLINALISHQTTEEQFDRVKQRLLRQYENRAKDRLTSQMYRELNHFLVKDHFSSDELANSLKRVIPSDMSLVQNNIRSGIGIEALMVGNLIPEDATKLGKRIAANFEISKAPSQNSKNIMILDRLTSHYEFESNQNDSGIVMYYQGENGSNREQALYQLLAQMISTEFFNQLRTEKQLGYVVQASQIQFEQLPGLGLIIQSPTADPGLLSLHIDKFLKDYLDWLVALDNAKFDQFKSGLITQLTEPDKNLLEQSSRYWDNIQNDVPHFNMKKRIALEVEKISQTGLIRFYQNQILSPDAKRISIYHAGKKHKTAFNENKRIKAGDKLLSEAENFQEGRPTFQF